MGDTFPVPMKTLSVVVPVYYNEANLHETIPRLLGLQASLPDMRLELIFVDDGSGDRSLSILLEHQKKNPESIRVVKLTRNFGAMAAVQAGFLQATGDCVGMVSADLQDPVHILVDMVAHWRKGARAVYAVRTARQDPLSSRIFSRLYYALVRRLVMADYPVGGFDFLLVDRQIIDIINGIREKNTNVMTLIHWLGFEPVKIPYERAQRKAGASRWTMRKKIKFFLDSFVAFSYVPIRFLSATGILLSSLAFVYAGAVFYDRLVNGVVVPGWTALALGVVFLGGLQILMLGVLGEYLWRTLDETRKRPSFVVDRVFVEGP